MARRNSWAPQEKPFTKLELQKIQSTLSVSSRIHLRQFYREAWEKAKLMEDALVPNPRAVQELVKAFRELWTRREFR